MNFVIRNIKKKMSIKESAEWFEREATIVKARRTSERGKTEYIFIVGASSRYGLQVNTNHTYISDTGMRHGGKGYLQIVNFVETDNSGNITAVANPVTLNEKEKLPVWIMV